LHTHCNACANFPKPYTFTFSLSTELLWAKIQTFISQLSHLLIHIQFFSNAILTSAKYSSSPQANVKINAPLQEFFDWNLIAKILGICETDYFELCLFDMHNLLIIDY